MNLHYNKNESNKLNKPNKKKDNKIDKIINNKIIKNNDYIEDNYESNDEDYYELSKLDKELSLKSKSNSTVHPKNYGNLWTEQERQKILKYLTKNIFDKESGMFEESKIYDIAKKLERTEYAVKEEIKKMIYYDFIEGENLENISKKFNIPNSNIKLILKFYIEKNSKNNINQLEVENKLLKLKIENIKLRKELHEITHINK